MKVTHHNLNIITISFFTLAITFFTSCSKDPIREITDDPDTTTIHTSFTNGIFIINEGNYNWGNATVSFIDEKTGNVQQNIFQKANQRSLGDVAQSMGIFRDFGLILVNNSNKVEVVDLKDFKSVKSITGFTSPRYLAIVDSNKAYVSNLKKDITVINLKDFTVERTIQTPTWTEGLIKFDHYVFVTSIGNYYSSNMNRKAQIYVIDTDKDIIVDSIVTGKEPLGIVMDRKQKIWVLCTGGYDHFEAPSLLRIDPGLRLIEKTFTFPSNSGIPSRLCINPTADTLYFIKDGIYQMPVASAELPSTSFIKSEGRLFYGLSIHPRSGAIFVSDAIDYVQNGMVYQYHQKTGQLIRSYTAGRIPGSFCFTSHTGN